MDTDIASHDSMIYSTVFRPTTLEMNLVTLIAGPFR